MRDFWRGKGGVLEWKFLFSEPGATAVYKEEKKKLVGGNGGLGIGGTWF